MNVSLLFSGYAVVSQWVFTISLKNKANEHLFMCLLAVIAYFVKYLLKSWRLLEGLVGCQGKQYEDKKQEHTALLDGTWSGLHESSGSHIVAHSMRLSEGLW